MPVGVAGGAAAVRALGWTWRWIWNGAARPAVVAHVDVGEVERVEHQLHPGPGQCRVDLVEVAVQADRRGRGDGAPFPPSDTTPRTSSGAISTSFSTRLTCMLVCRGCVAMSTGYTRSTSRGLVLGLDSPCCSRRCSSPSPRRCRLPRWARSPGNTTPVSGG